MSLILHITESRRWARTRPTGSYTAKTQQEDGFIHCSDPSQLADVAKAFYSGKRGLVLLCIDPRKVRAEVRYEKSGSDVFPHIYGPLNTDAVVAVLPFEPDGHGSSSTRTHAESAGQT
ncbi:MAG: DUF952 domain-containing protein [Nitrososphaerota archaeon]|nr:DUF952 domain-containing protein [Nitrososphaerota archaeon]MDG6955443.1 DUF952 domain-containing protein [Nitrososphaerota archaeon]